MTAWWTPVAARLCAILESGYGSALTAPTRYLTAATLHARRIDRELDDPDGAHADYDRAYALRVTGRSQIPEGVNQYSGSALVRVGIEVLIGYEISPRGTASESPDAGVGETAQSLARSKALDDWHVAERALSWPPNWTGLTPELVGVSFEAAGLQVVTPRRLLLRATGTALVAFDPATVYDLGS